MQKYAHKNKDYSNNKTPHEVAVNDTTDVIWW